jgi:cystathionine beta-synthase
MMAKGYFDKKGLTAKDLAGLHANVKLITIESTDTIGNAVELLNKMDISQIPVTSDKRIVGSLTERLLYQKIIANPDIKNQPVSSVMAPPFPFVDISTPIDSLSKMVNEKNSAVLVKDFKLDKTYIITSSDILNAMVK